MIARATITFYILTLSLMLSGCGVHYMVKGQVVDAVTKQPIEGAVVAVEWYYIQWMSCLIPLTSGHETVANADSITDADGMFTIPRYHHITTGGHFMGAYKEGYICWNNEEFFNPDGKTTEEMFTPRRDPGVYEGMVIELEPIKKEGFPVLEHAKFVSSIRDRVAAENFFFATKKEREIESESNRKNMGIKK
ncbi:MAG: hypothetical protein M0036_12310 [Desulfobacteraceae bacterium]|nr:hypothetical protein [Desulfobacteraceae bacterium]